MRLQGLFMLLGPILLNFLATALADNRMDVKVDQLVTHEEQGQQIGYRQSKWLEKFKRPKPTKSHYGKPKAHFRAPRPYHGAPITTHYTPQKTSYYQNPTPYKTAYPLQPTYVLTPSAGGPSKANYYQNASPYNAPHVAYRTPANRPSHPSFSKPEGEYSPSAPAYQELVNTNPAEPYLNYIPSQPVISQSPVYTPSVNTPSVHPPFSQPGHVNGPVDSEPGDYRNPENSQQYQPTPEYVPSNHANPLPAIYLAPVTNNQEESYSLAEPTIIKPLQDFKDIINNSPQLSHSHVEQVNNPSVQDHKASVSEEPTQHSVDNIPFEPVNPSIYELQVDNNPGQFPFSHLESVNNSPLPNYEELSHNNPLESSFSQPEPVSDNSPEQSYDHQEPINNSPTGYGEQANDSPPEPSYNQQESANSQLPSNFNEQVDINLPQVFHGQKETVDSNPSVQPSFVQPDSIDNQPSFHSNPLQSFYSEQELVDYVPLSDFEAPVNNDVPNPSFDYIPSELSGSNEEPVYNQPFHVEESPQSAFIEVPQSTPKTQGHNTAAESFLPTEAPSFYSSTNSPVVSTESETPLDFPHSPFSTNVEGDTPPLFFDEFTKSERESQDPDAGFFEFGIFPKSNNFFLQNYRG